MQNANARATQVFTGFPSRAGRYDQQRHVYQGYRRTRRHKCLTTPSGCTKLYEASERCLQTEQTIARLLARDARGHQATAIVAPGHDCPSGHVVANDCAAQQLPIAMAVSIRLELAQLQLCNRRLPVKSFQASCFVYRSTAFRPAQSRCHTNGPNH